MSRIESEISVIFSILNILFSLGSFVPYLAVIWRRLHDTGRSGKFYFFVLIPLVGPILLIVWLAGRSRLTGARFETSPAATGSF